MAEAQLQTYMRDMTPDDAPEVAALEKVSFTDAWSEDLFRASLKYDYNHVILLIEKETEKIIGYVVYSLVEGEMNLDNICIAKEFRGKHLGESLFDEAILRAECCGAEVCYLEVRASNLPAISLYKKKGFVFDRIRKAYYVEPTEDAMLFHRKCENRLGG